MKGIAFGHKLPIHLPHLRADDILTLLCTKLTLPSACLLFARDFPHTTRHNHAPPHTTMFCIPLVQYTTESMHQCVQREQELQWSI